MTFREPTQTLDDLLRRCVGCGLCLPHCATWVETRNETFSPRGRLLLLADLLAEPTPETKAAYQEAFDLCIGCRACENACPSGVPFSLLEHGQNLTNGSVPGVSRYLPRLSQFLDSLELLRVLRHGGNWGRQFLRVMFGAGWRRRLNSAPLGGAQLVRLLGTMPVCADQDEDLIRQLDRLLVQPAPSVRQNPDPGDPAQPVALFRGCGNEGLMPGATRRLKELLTAGGCPIISIQGQECCGALAAHTGRPGKAARLRHGNLEAFSALKQDHLTVVVEAAGCGMQLQEYGETLPQEVRDAAVFLDSLVLPALREVPLKVVYHDPCHALHGQGIEAEPRRLLARIPGLELVAAEEAEVCCGSGGAWGVEHVELSARLGRSKARSLAGTGADLVVTSNPGCLGQIADGLALEAPSLPIIPLTDLLWYACFTSEV